MSCLFLFLCGYKENRSIEQQLRGMGINPEDPAAMASIQRAALTFFNVIDKKDGSPYIFQDSITERTEDFKRSEPSADSD